MTSLIRQLVFIIGLATFAHAEGELVSRVQDFLVSAESSERNMDEDTLSLRGKIQIISKGQYIKADEAFIDLRTKTIELRGDVEISRQDELIRGSYIQLNYDQDTGTIYDGQVQMGSIHFSGKTLYKVAAHEYLVSEANYTTCKNCPNTWKFSGSSIRAEMGGYAYIKNSVLRVSDIPVFYLPYLVVPLKSDRQTGLLTPYFERSDKGGLTISQPFFWVISPTSDLTYTLRMYELRGTKSLINHRYVLAQNSQGELDLAYLNDQVFKNEGRLNQFRTDDQRGQSIHRYFMKYQHYFELPDGSIQRASINTASDLQYPKDFPGEALVHGDPAMENRFSLTKNFESIHLSADMSYYTNLLKSNPLGVQDDTVHRWPELQISQSQQSILDTDWNYQFDVTYTKFARSGKSYDDLSGVTTYKNTDIRYVRNSCSDPNFDATVGCTKTDDGAFNPYTDLIRSGQRTEFRPTISRSVHLGDNVDLLPKISYRETHYNFAIDKDSNMVRRLVRAEINSRSIISKVYTTDTSSRYKHEIIPEITYTTIPWLDQPQHPFWGFSNVEAPNYSQGNISDGDLGSDYSLQFDYSDRIYDRNLVTFGVTNKLIEKRYTEATPSYRQIALLKISQSYDAYQAGLSTRVKEPYSDLRAILDVRLDHLYTYSVFNYYPYQNVTNVSSQVKVTNDEGRFIQVGLTKQYKITPGQEVDPSNRVEDYSLSSGFSLSAMDLIGRIVYDANWENSKSADRKAIKSWAYIAQFKPPGDCWYIRLEHSQIVGGDTNIRFSFEFSFDGKQAQPPAPGLLDTLVY